MSNILRSGCRPMSAVPFPCEHGQKCGGSRCNRFVISPRSKVISTSGFWACAFWISTACVVGLFLQYQKRWCNALYVHNCIQYILRTLMHLPRAFAYICRAIRRSSKVNFRSRGRWVTRDFQPTMCENEFPIYSFLIYIKMFNDSKVITKTGWTNPAMSS